MEPSQTEKKVSDLSESQRNKVHSLFKVPFLHKSETGADENDESRTGDTISQVSSLRQTPSSKMESSSREGSKSGTGRKLLNMLRKTLKGSESKDLDVAQDLPSLVPFGDVVGCLAVHIKKCRHFSPRINLQYYTNLFIRITINKIMKCTKAHSVNFKNNEKKPAVKFDEVKYFSVQVPRRQDDERNMIYLELMEFDDLEAYPVLLGSFSLHLYEIIQVVCKVEVEFMFSYGNFGYGFSHQLKPLQKLIQPSMFMHIPPPVERTDPLTNVITPQPIEYPAFLSPDLNVTVGTQQKQTNASSPVRLEKLQQQPRDRLDRMKKEYRNLKTWEEKSKYLDQILRMKTETKESPDSKDPEDKDDLQEMDENPLPENLFQTPDLLFKKQEDEPLPSELPVNIPEVKSPPLVEKEAEPSDSSLIIQEDAETKNESLPLEESTPLTPVSLKEKDISVESINGRDDELILENIEPEEEMTEKEISDSASLVVEPKQSQTDSEKTDSIQSETKLKSIILSPDRKKKSIDESVADPMRQESKRSSEFLQDLKEDIESGIKMSLPRHVSFNISDEGVELPSKTDDVLKIEELISLDRDKDKDEKKEKDKEGVDEKNETENIETDEEKEIIIRNTYMEDLEDFTFRPTRPESIPIFQGYNKPILIHRGKFEPFLRNITEIPINEDHKRIQNEPVCTVVKKNTSSAEIIEHEDQDPPYAPTSSSITVNSENSSWDSNPDIFTIKSLDTEEIERGLSSLSLESLEAETAFTVDIDLVGKEQENLLSELLELNPSLEKLEKTVVLKSILNDDLKDLSDELFSKQGILMEIEAERKTQSLLTLDDKTLGSVETVVFENAQNEIKIVHSEQIELSGKKSSKSSKKDLKIVQSEQLSELSRKKSSSSKSSFKNGIKNVHSEPLSELSGKKSSSSKSLKNDLKIVQSEQSVVSGKTSSSSKSFKNDFKFVQSEQFSELSKELSLDLKSSPKNLKTVQSEQLSELSGKISSGSKFSKTDLRILQSEQIELLGKISSSSKSSKTDLKIVQNEQLELSGKLSSSSSSKSSMSDLKIVQSEQLGELLEKKSSSSKSSKTNLKIVQSEQVGELLEKKSLKSSKSDFRIVQSEQLGELSEKTSSDSKSSLKTDLKIMQSEESGELSEKTSLGSKPYKSDFSIVLSEQSSEHLGKKSSISKPPRTDFKIAQSEQLSELSEKTSLGSKPYKSDLSIVQSEQSSEHLGKKSSISKPPKTDFKIPQSEQLSELSEKTSLGSKPYKSDLSIVQSEQSSEHLGKKSSISKPPKTDFKIAQSEQLSELSEKTSLGSKPYKSDLSIVQSEQSSEHLGKKSSISKPPKTDFKIPQSEQLSELSEKTSLGSKPYKSDLSIVQSEQSSEHLGKKSSISKPPRTDLKIVLSESLDELSEKTSLGSKPDKSDLSIVQSEQLSEHLGKKSSISKPPKTDFKIPQSESLDELSEKTSLGSKPDKSDLSIAQSERSSEHLGKKSSVSKPPRTDLKIVLSESLDELSEKTSLGSKPDKSDLSIVQSEQSSEHLGKKSSISKPPRTDLKIVLSESLDELSEKTSLGSKSSKSDLKIVQSEQLSEHLEKKSSIPKPSKTDLKIVQGEQSGELLEKKSSSSKPPKTDLKIVQGELLCELLEKSSSSSKSSKTDLKTGQSEQLSELSEKTSLGSKPYNSDLSIIQSEQSSEYLGKKSSISKPPRTDLKIVLSESLDELSEKTSLGSKSSKSDLKIVQSEQLSEHLEKKSSSSKPPKTDLKIVQGELLCELLEKSSSSSKSSKTDLKIVQGELLCELLEKSSSSLKSSKTNLKIVQSEQSSELLEKKNSSSESSKTDLKIVQSEQVEELLEKTSSSSKSSKTDLQIVQNEQLAELSEKTTSSLKSSKTDLQIVQNEQVGELLEKTSSSSKPSITDLKIVQDELLYELLEKSSSSSESSKTELKIGQSEQSSELLEKKSSSSRSSKTDLKTGQGEQSGEFLEKKSSSSKPSKTDLKIVQGELLCELLEKSSSSSRSSKTDLKIGQSEQSGELLEKKSSSSKSSKTDLKTGEGEQSSELLEKKSSSSRSSKTDLKTGQGEQSGELLEKKSSSSRSSKTDLKTGQSEQSSELLEKKSSSSRSSKTNLKTGQGEQSSELLEKKSSSSRSSKTDLKTGQGEQSSELLEKKSSSSRSSKTDLKTGQGEQSSELLEKKSSSSRSSKTDLKTGQGEQSSELLEKKSSSSRSSKTDFQIVQSEQLCELLEKKSSSSKSSKSDLKIAQGEQLCELLEKKSSNSKSSKSDLKIVQNEQLCELLEKKSSSSKSSKTDLKTVQHSEQVAELLEKKSSSSKSSKTELKTGQSEQLCELLEKKSSSSKSSKNDLKIGQGQQLCELLENQSSSSKSSKNDLKIMQGEQTETRSSSSESIKKDTRIVQRRQLDERSGKTSSSSKSSLENDLKILNNERNDLSLRKILSLNSFSKEILKDDPMEVSSGSQIEEITEKMENFYIPMTYDEPEDQLSIMDEDFSNGRKHSFKKKHPEEYFQKNSEEVIRSFSVVSIAESFESPENVAFIEQISSEPNITELDLEHGMSLMDFPSSLTVWDSGLASTSEDSNEKLSGVDVSKSKSFVRHIFLHAFPSDSLESGIVRVIELDKDDYHSSWLDTETNLSEEKPTMMEESWNLPLKNSKNQFLQDKDDLPQTEKLYREKNFEEKDLNSVLESASNYIMHKLSDADRTRLKSFANNVFKNLSTENIPEPKIEKERQKYFIPGGEKDLEELDAHSVKGMSKSDDLNVKHAATPKRSSFEEFLSGSEAGHLSSDLGKHIQNFLVENLSESGKFSKGDLPKLFENFYLVNNKKKSPTSMKTEQLPKGQNNLKDFPETFPKSMPPMNNSNRPLSGDKHLEIRLRALLNEILEQYILTNYAETKLTSERESDTKDPNLPPHRTKTVPPFSYEVRHDYPERNFSGDSDINRDLTQTIQDLLFIISENELLNLKSDLSKHLQSLFIERLSNMGLITEKEFHTLNENLSLINSSDRPLKFLSSDLRGLNQFLERPSEKQSYKTFPRNMSQDDEKISNIELARKLEREYIALHNIKRRSVLRDDERQYPRERVGKQGLTGVKASRKSSQEFLLNTSERITKLVLRREQKDHNVMQLPQVEKTGFEEDFQDLHGWYNKPKTNHSKATLKIKPLEKKENYNIYKVTVKEKPESVVIPGVQNSEVQPEIKEYLYKYKLPSSGNAYAYLNSEDEEESNLKDYCYGKSKENNKKKPLLTVTQFQKELQTVYVKPKETTTEKCSPTPQSFDHSRVVEFNNSKPSIFPEVLKTESLKPKNRREREYVEKQKRPLYRTAKILAASQPTTRLLLRKSPQRTLLFPWTGKRNIHDSSENKKEDIHLTSFKHLEKAKARARFDLGKSPEDNQYTLKNLARPNTAPEFNKRLKENFGKFTSPRVVSAGLFHLNVTNPSLEEYNQKKDLKDLEKCSIICDILQLLNSSYVKRKYEDDY
ncbi:cation channel sperm-associated targeting subunit tau isoform 2-T2 [Sarcophilus harrisii]